MPNNEIEQKLQLSHVLAASKAFAFFQDDILVIDPLRCFWMVLAVNEYRPETYRCLFVQDRLLIDIPISQVQGLLDRLSGPYSCQEQTEELVGPMLISYRLANSRVLDVLPETQRVIDERLCLWVARALTQHSFLEEEEVWLLVLGENSLEIRDCEIANVIEKLSPMANLARRPNTKK